MRDWRIRRTCQPHPAGQRQWDRAYQQLLAWTQPADGCAAVPVGPAPPRQEVSHESRSLCTCIDTTSGTGRRRPLIWHSTGYAGGTLASFAQQLERLQAHAQAQGWTVAAEDIFRDDGYSGASLKRPGLERLRDRAALCALDRVLITAPDRLARQYVHQPVCPSGAVA